jgi:hypothetical protein
MITRKAVNAEEFMQRTLAKNRERSERQRQRMLQSGKTALTVWLPAELKAALTTAAAERGATIADTATALLTTALQTHREHFDDAADRIGAALATAQRDVDDLHSAVIESGERFRSGVTSVVQRQRDEAAAAGMLLPTLTPILAEPTTTATVEPTDCVFPTDPADKDALMITVATLLDSGVSGAEIVRRLNDSGQRTASGTTYTSSNLLKAYRRWQANRDTIE